VGGREEMQLCYLSGLQANFACYIAAKNAGLVVCLEVLPTVCKTDWMKRQEFSIFLSTSCSRPHIRQAEKAQWSMLDRVPVNFHSVIDNPDLVSRVIPPSNMRLKTHPVHTPSHTHMLLLGPSGRPLATASPALCT
jgi:hypothetical protein